MLQRTLVLIKPDGVYRSLVGDIISRFEKRGLKIIGLKLVQIDKNHAETHYDVHKEKPFFDRLVGFLVSGPVVAIVIEGIDAIENTRKIVGPTEPKSAQPGTIRGDYSHISYKYADEKGKAIQNIIHASDSSESAKKEIETWFSEEELCNYKLPIEEHVF